MRLLLSNGSFLRANIGPALQALTGGGGISTDLGLLSWLRLLRAWKKKTKSLFTAAVPEW